MRWMTLEAVALSLLAGAATAACRDRVHEDDGTMTRDETPRQTAARDLPRTRTEPAPLAPVIEPAPPPQAPPAPAPDRLEAAQVWAVFDVAHAGEIDQARLATARARSGEVRDFAQMMVREHTQALHDGRELAKRLDLHPAACPLADEIRQKSGELIRALRERRGRDFDREYVRAQIEEHQGLLRQIDERLRPSSDGDLALYVDDMRGAVQRHLTAAQALQGRVAIR